LPPPVLIQIVARQSLILPNDPDFLCLVLSGADCKGAITRSLERAGAIAGSRPAVAGVLQWLCACTIHASAHFDCRVERPIRALRRASNTVSFRVPAQPRYPQLNGFDPTPANHAVVDCSDNTDALIIDWCKRAYAYTAIDPAQGKVTKNSENFLVFPAPANPPQ
jgi:hypothetical protein